jgi:hypothetical protein
MGTSFTHQFKIVLFFRIVVATAFLYSHSFRLSPEEVMAFCTNCVLSDDEEPCDIPEEFYNLEKLSP